MHLVWVTNNSQVVDKSVKPDIDCLRWVTWDTDPPMYAICWSRDRDLSLSLFQFLQNFVSYRFWCYRILRRFHPLTDLLSHSL